MDLSSLKEEGQRVFEILETNKFKKLLEKTILPPHTSPPP
jgi:hypothetical protein